MSAIDLKPLMQRLDDTCRKGLEAAAGQTLSRSHFNVEIEHWLLQLLDVARSDLLLIAARFDIDRDRLAAECTRSLDRMRTGNGRAPALSPELVRIVKDAWLFASVQRGEYLLRSGHLIWAMLSDESIAQRLAGTIPSMRQAGPDTLQQEFDDILAGSGEQPETAVADGHAHSETSMSGTVPKGPGPGGAVSSTAEALARFTIDLTAQASAGRIDPILGRDDEIRQVIDILTRRRQNNPILTGEAGVGKTAVVEGLALRIAAGDVPPPLRDLAIHTLDLGLLAAGAGIKGEFESRLRAVIDAVRGSPRPMILFVDEAHMLIGAGGASGQGDAANLLKPALARGELRVIAATTWAEYKKYFEQDAALTRRFQTVKIEEPSEPVAIDMVRGLLPSLESHHKVRILDEALAAAVRLSARFIPARQLPDKAVSLIDTACARVAMSRSATPAVVQDRQRRTTALDSEIAVLRREAVGGADHKKRLASLHDERLGVADELARLQQRWQQERELVVAIDAHRSELEAIPDDDELRDKLTQAWSALNTLQDSRPMVFPVVDAQSVAEIVETWTGIPAGRMQADQIRVVLGLREALERRVVGQDHALEAVAQAIRTSRAGLTDPRKPVGVFLMVGTSGVGKTETALALAELLYGGEQNLTTINMNEYKEEHKVSLLMGSPPGYVGYGDGGILTEAVRRRPHSVILLDEIEKAHPGVQDVFFQLFDKGTMKDGEGRSIDFRNTVVIMTSNAGAETLASLFADPMTAPDAAALPELLRGDLGRHFKPAFLSRVTVVPYLPLDAATLRKIAGMQLQRVQQRVAARFGVVLQFDEEFADRIQQRCSDPSVGARGIETLLSRTLLPELSRRLLSRMADADPVERIGIGFDGDALDIRIA